ncbi:hypothetical protein [Thalassospira sp. UBA1131]|uniref:hypothetical protein n=1 Tax=Thalassospira sp. UBA1131 TaxID=1947672 RepID=UPI0025CB9DB6|nr:hypothetical protein [Thalassospira sp. UBA1131]
MKKILFATSAIVAVAAAGSAQASEPIQLSVGGFMNQWIGFADEDNTGAGGRKNAFHLTPRFTSLVQRRLITESKLVQ